eukprot:TRINITY_DN9673_c0_g1_i1.p1 TRINITY_DN9673_c0_g1~~TRINITY_DN9673_c0_g1_i1.p1  ORF type:complete len:353 (-),score=44.13 TRINITY_DN9673_c0_g1_i1:81-1139(-)
MEFQQQKRGCCARVGSWFSSFIESCWDLVLFGQDELRLVFQSQRTKYLFLFICCSVNFLLIELIYGYFYNSFALIANAIYNLFATWQLGIKLLSMLLVHHPPTEHYTYGFWGIETLGYFTNGITHAFLSVFLIYEAAERFLEGESSEIGGGQVIVIALIGFGLNLVGGLVFERYRTSYSARTTTSALSISGVLETSVRSGSQQKATNPMIADIFVVALLIGSILFSADRDLPGTDSVVAIIIAIYIFFCAIVLAMHTGKTMLQTTPPQLKSLLDKSRSEAEALEGVLECHNNHFWTQSVGVTGEPLVVGSFVARVREGADEQLILAKLHNIFSPFVQDITIEIEQDRSVDLF